MGPTAIRRSSTRRRDRALAVWVALAVVLAAPAGAEELRGSATPGLRLYHLNPRFRDDDVTSWFDRYQHIHDKSPQVPWFLDLLHLDTGLWREDETPIARLERWSPWAWNERALLDVDWRGLDLEAGSWRTWIGELATTPRGTGQDGEPVLPRLGSLYHDDTDPDDHFYVRRFGGGGALRLRPDGFGDAVPHGLLEQLTLYGRREHRSGQQQETFLLQADEVGIGQDDERFRGTTGDIDQDVTTLGARLVAEPAGIATGALDVSVERFRDRDSTFTVADAAARAGGDLTPPPATASRPIGFVPDTNRITGSLRLSRRLGEATVHGGAFATRLAQTGTRPAPQRAAGFDDLHVSTVSAHAAADVPLNEWLSFDAFGKFARRHNGIERDTAIFSPDDGTQLAPFLDVLRDWQGGAELSAFPAPGTRFAAGWRLRAVDRELDYAEAIGPDGAPRQAIRPPFSVVDYESRAHTVYLRSYARLLRRLRVSGEVGFEWAPTLGSPRELEQATYGRMRGSHTWRRPRPITLALFGGWLDGEGHGLLLESTTPGRSKRKDFERTCWDAGATLSVVSDAATALFATFVRQRDDQQFPYVRSNVPRFNGPPFLRFYLDSHIGWQSDAMVLAVGATRALADALDLALAATLTKLDARFPGDDPTAAVLEEVDRIEVTIASLEAGLGVQVAPRVRLGVGWRSDRYHDAARIDEPNLDGWQHALTLSATIDFERPLR